MKKHPAVNSEYQSPELPFAEFVIIISLMMSLTALSIDAMMPALPQIGSELGVRNTNDRQLIISMIFLGLAVGQLFFGPLSDKTGRIKGVMWDRVDETAGEISSGDFVHVTGNVSEYKDMLQLVVKTMNVCSTDSIEPADFLPTTQRDIEAMFERLLQIAASIQTECIKSLLQAFWDGFNGMLYCHAPETL